MAKKIGIKSIAIRQATILAEPQDKEVDLLIRFMNGASYTYLNVPRRVAEHLINRAPSKGSYFHSAIRDEYDWVKTSKGKVKK